METLKVYMAHNKPPTLHVRQIFNYSILFVDVEAELEVTTQSLNVNSKLIFYYLDNFTPSI